jgi:hypothetical protein
MGQFVKIDTQEKSRSYRSLLEWERERESRENQIEKKK